MGLPRLGSAALRRHDPRLLVARLGHPEGFRRRLEGAVFLARHDQHGRASHLEPDDGACRHRRGGAAWRRARWLLLATAALGLVFLAIKFTEYHEEASKGLAPILGIPFRYDGTDPTGAALFFNLYFAMTGLHAAHLLSGILVVGWIALFWFGKEPPSRLRRVGAIGLYWHFIDVVWVFLYPILYLINR